MKSFIVKVRTKTLIFIVLFALLGGVVVAMVEKFVFTTSFPILTMVWFVAIILSTVLITFIILRNYLKESIMTTHSQLESQLSIMHIVNPRLPLPNTRGWAASPDFLRLIIENILVRKPKTILELGGGVSTLYIAYVLEKIKSGKIYSVDHLDEYAKITRNRIKDHGLSQFVEVLFSPLEDIEVKQKKRKWYKKFVTNEMGKIDMLIVDGPPTSVQNKSRYPAMPLLYEYLSDNALIIIDDYIRKEDKEAVDMWLREYPALKIHTINTEKGTAILSKESKRSST